MEGFFVVAAMFVLVGMPVLSITCAYVLTNVAKRYFQLRQQELELRRWEVESRLEQARLTSGMPMWIDKTDPMEVAAWHKAVVEIYKMSVNRSIAG